MKDIASLEMFEFLLASNRKNHSQSAIRDVMRLHRFQVFNWLMANGVAIPAVLLDDRTHPLPGDQRPDRPL